ncbi:MAG: hypothetical protein WC761_00075 [Candidatus Paceibacterota bacterium]|jgi:hypothetical protein
MRNRNPSRQRSFRRILEDKVVEDMFEPFIDPTLGINRKALGDIHRVIKAAYAAGLRRGSRNRS